MLPLDASSLECLVAIAIVSYVLGYLAAQMQFRPRTKARGRGAGYGLGGESVSIFRPVLGPFQPCAWVDFLNPVSQPNTKAAIATAVAATM
jgi:hypothetical protein